MIVDDANPFVGMERTASSLISQWLDGYRQVRDTANEALFKAMYGQTGN